jgi:glycogen(starch) synthase
MAMRVLFWSGTFWPQIGGVEVLAAKFLPALRARGYEYVVVAPKSFADLPDESHFKGIPVYRFPFQNSPAYGYLDHFLTIRQKISLLKRRFAPDLVHINSVGVDNFFHLSTASAHRAPILVTLHGKWTNQTEAIVGHILRAADWVVACSASLLDLARHLAPEITSRSSVIYNGIEALGPFPRPLPTNPPRLLCVGRVVADKRFDLALSAFASLDSRFPGMRLIVAGDGPERVELECQAHQLGIRDRVDFLGWVAPDVVSSLIDDATIIIIPSQHEAFPLVALQAGLMARPVVATRVGGLPEIVVHGETGLLVECNDFGALAQSVALLLDHPHKALQMGKAARERVFRMFSFEHHVNAYDALYAEIVANWRAKGASPRL